MFKATMTAKGQLVIPSAIRKRYGLEKGVAVSVQEQEGKIILQPITEEYITKMAGFLPKRKGKSLTQELLEERRKDREREDKKWKRFSTRKP